MIPENPNIDYLAYSLIFAGVFLFVSGLNIIKVEKITIKPGLKTWVTGIFLVISGLIIVMFPGEISNKFFYVCYDKKVITGDKPQFFNCQQSQKSCISINKNLIQFGRYTTEKDSYMALERCKSNIPR